MKKKTAISALMLLCAALLLQGCATSKSKTKALNVATDDARAYFEVLRSDFNSGKVRIVNNAMKLTEAEADQFWPIYRSYEQDLAPIGDRKLALIREFLANHNAGTLNDEKSKELAAKWLENAQDRLDLWKKYHARISERISPVRAAQFLQVENQMALFLDLCIASEMPLIGSKPESTQ